MPRIGSFWGPVYSTHTEEGGPGDHCFSSIMKDQGSIFLTQKGKRRGRADDAIDADQLEEMVAGVAQTSQSTLLLKKKKEMREVCGACTGWRNCVGRPLDGLLLKLCQVSRQNLNIA